MKCIQLDNLHLEYRRGKTKALNGLNLQVDQGSFLGLVGPNGSGKTTLIHILAGLLKQDRGQIRLFNQEILSASFSHRQRMGFVLDQPVYFDRLTCREFLMFAGKMYEIPKEELEGKVEELLRFFDLMDAEDKWIETYSKGMKQKVSIAAAIIHEPDLLILDEPFDGIDATSAEEIKEILLQMNKKGVTIVITSHQLELIEALCTECAILHKGQIVFQSKIDELEKQLQESGNSKAQTSLKEIFLQITSADRPHKSLSWLS